MRIYRFREMLKEDKIQNFPKNLIVESLIKSWEYEDLIKQLKSYDEFYRDFECEHGIMVFIHLYDLEEREVKALKMNNIQPVDGRLLLE